MSLKPPAKIPPRAFFVPTDRLSVIMTVVIVISGPYLIYGSLNESVFYMWSIPDSIHESAKIKLTRELSV